MNYTDDMIQEVMSANGAVTTLLRYVGAEASENNHYDLHEARNALLEAQSRLRKAAQHLVHFAEYPCRTEEEIAYAEAQS